MLLYWLNESNFNGNAKESVDCFKRKIHFIELFLVMKRHQERSLLKGRSKKRESIFSLRFIRAVFLQEKIADKFTEIVIPEKSIRTTFIKSVEKGKSRNTFDSFPVSIT